MKSKIEQLPIPDAETIRAWDRFTIENEPVSSVDLMARAGAAAADYIGKELTFSSDVIVFCGTGNNGGDGLVIASILSSNHRVEVWIYGDLSNASQDFQYHFQKLTRENPDLKITINNSFPTINETTVLIDALFGTGISRKIEGETAKLIQHINQSQSKVYAIDLPSGLFCDQHTPIDFPVVHATLTLSFQVPKLAFMFPENADRVGHFICLDIGLHPSLPSLKSISRQLVSSVSCSLTGNKFDHKGKNGHLLIIAGSEGKSGAAILATGAALRSGAGLVSVLSDAATCSAINVVHPSAMTIVNKNSSHFGDFLNLDPFDSIVIGPGLGTASPALNILKHVLNTFDKQIVIDADAINLLAANAELLKKLNSKVVLTPHFKEFSRICGDFSDDFERHFAQQRFSTQWQCYLVLKGHHTCISNPGGWVFFNSTGNPGMAKGGSGDVLAGLMGGLLMRCDNIENAIVTSVYVHGKSGDMAAKKISEWAMNANDLIDFLPQAFQECAGITN